MWMWSQPRTRDVAAEGGGAAALDGRHDLQLGEAQMAGLSVPPGSPVGAEDIRDLQTLARHDAADQLVGGSPGLRCSSGLWTALSVVLVMWL